MVISFDLPPRIQKCCFRGGDKRSLGLLGRKAVAGNKVPLASGGFILSCSSKAHCKRQREGGRTRRAASLGAGAASPTNLGRKTCRLLVGLLMVLFHVRFVGNSPSSGSLATPVQIVFELKCVLKELRSCRPSKVGQGFIAIYNKSKPARIH